MSGTVFREFTLSWQLILSLHSWTFQLGGERNSLGDFMGLVWFPIIFLPLQPRVLGSAEMVKNRGPRVSQFQHSEFGRRHGSFSTKDRAHDLEAEASSSSA